MNFAAKNRRRFNDISLFARVNIASFFAAENDWFFSFLSFSNLFFERSWTARV